MSQNLHLPLARARDEVHAMLKTMTNTPSVPLLESGLSSEPPLPFCLLCTVIKRTYDPNLVPASKNISNGRCLYRFRMAG